MIKLKNLIDESLHGEKRPSQDLDDLLKSKVQFFSGMLYHGSPIEGLKSILLNKIYGTEHGEIAEYDSFSTSVNPNVLNLFSEMDGETGLSFEVKDVNLIVIDDIIHKLLIEERASGMEVDINEKIFIDFCNQYKVQKNRWGEYHLPYGYLSSLGFDVFTFDYVWKNYNHGHGMFRNDESEFCFIGNGIDKLNNFIDMIYVDGEEYHDKKAAIESIDEKL